MSVVEVNAIHVEDWVKKFDPQKRIVTGEAYLIAKRFMDLFLVVVTLPLWLPLTGLIALIIRATSPGAPVVFKQLRTGKGGRRFYMYLPISPIVGGELDGGGGFRARFFGLALFKITNDP